MFQNRRHERSLETDQQANIVEPNLKYPHPQITTIDLDAGAVKRLLEAGFTVNSGSFGKPYRIRPHASTSLEAIKANASFPSNISESDILIVDMTTPERISELDSPGDVQRYKDGTGYAIGSEFQSYFDPRPFIMGRISSKLDQVIEHGGVALIFAAPKTTELIVRFAGNSLSAFEQGSLHNWNFLSSLLDIDVNNTNGNVVTFDITSDLGRWLNDRPLNFQYSCTFTPNSRYLTWAPLATNKYGQTVSAAISQGDGLVVLLPQTTTKDHLLHAMLTDFLPQWRPKLFPDFEGHSWITTEEYELPEILQLKAEAQQILRYAEAQVEEINGRIERIREEKAYLSALLTCQGDELVAAVKQTLDQLGFQSVIDMDEQAKGGNLQEDLQILDSSPLVLVEIKGVSGNPKDEDVLQVGKYRAPRMKELGRFDIRGLTIVNHQMYLPPLERDKPFRELHLQNAIEQEIGLMSTWTLYRLARSFLKNSWKHEFVRDLFYQNGEIDALPRHYKYVGEIERVFSPDRAFGVVLEAGVEVGDRVAFELQVEFVEDTIASLENNYKKIDVASTGMQTGIKITNGTIFESLRKGIRVFKVTEL